MFLDPMGKYSPGLTPEIQGWPTAILGIGSAQQEDRLDRHRRTGVRPAHLQKMSPLMILPTKVNL
jgi:hypothetical protein